MSASASSSSSPTSSSPAPPTVSFTDNPKPRLTIPEPICSDVPGSWAYDTMSRRVDEEILQRTLEDNIDVLGTSSDPKYRQVVTKFQSLRDELRTSSPIKMLEELDLSHPDYTNEEKALRRREYDEWSLMLQALLENNHTWLTAPWLVAEFYVYRRLIEATGFWDRSSPLYKFDPFQKQKNAGLVSSVGSAEPMLGKVLQLDKLTTDASKSSSSSAAAAGGGSTTLLENGVNIAASIALWGNKMDLSLWPADAANADVDIFSSILEKAHENLLHDDSKTLAEHCIKLHNDGGGNVDIIVDNAGFELITDLALAQYLVDSGIAKCVTFQLKSHPTFVSDALEKDLLEHIEHYASLDETTYPNAKESGQKWKQFIQDGRWKANEDNFWCQPFAMWDMTEPLRSDLRDRCDLAFVKGDANYRRLLGDCMWDRTAPFEDVVGSYFPCPVCALRTLKAEIGCGMDADQIERAKSLDDNWQVNGRFGVVHFGRGAPKSE
eukprot:CAMPEP_0113468152 /NCGR_PEP_ID=MMETSP0014_2-20120614/15201_1 /TAXON_ID=2857 /ORGANISM="Nitzschia sp." /LENGTH=492 /DNA_ID=CAMNT_0000360519 /DNA_START=250 /DNA_END=1728 /DNA_ORIENTATION=- /assembly_acc=CAM_ASM_000159